MMTCTLLDQTRTFAVAHSWFDRMRGLSRTSRDDWAHVDGMWFDFPSPRRWPVWMRGMRFPIDLIWLYEGRIVDHQRHVTPDNPWHIWRPKHPASVLIELISDGNVESS